MKRPLWVGIGISFAMFAVALVQSMVSFNVLRLFFVTVFYCLFPMR